MKWSRAIGRVIVIIVSLVALTPAFADAAKDHAFAYDASKPVNNGKAITIKFWAWTGFDYLYKVWAEDYQKLHPNAKVDFTAMPYADYWKKLPLAISSGQGPDVYAMHNQYTSLIVDGKLASPYPAEWVAQLKNDFNFVETHIINGKLYYMDSGMMSAMIFYNKKLWKEAGLTDADLPASWDQLAAVAKKLTRLDASGKMLQEGFGLNGSSGYLLDALAYQLGSTIYKPGGRAVVADAAHRKAIQRLIDFYDVDKVSSRDFPDSFNSFAQGKAAMTYAWGWFNGYLVANNPDISFGAIKLPTWDGTTPPAYERCNGEATFCANPKASAANQKVAFDFIHYCIDNAEYAKQMALKGSMAPVMKRIAQDEDLLSDTAVSTTLRMLDRTIWPGAVPPGWESALTKAVVDGIKTGLDADAILATYEKENNKDLAKYKNVYWDQERVYKHASEMLK